MEHRFPKRDKLCGTIRIQSLYREGKRFTAWPLRVTYRKDDEHTRVLIWAPKSLFKHAVDRNRMRRVMREAWRLNYNEKAFTQSYQVSIVYMDKQLQDYEAIVRAMKKIIKHLSNPEQKES